MPERLNEDIAGRLEEVARLLAAQGANRFRVGAYERAANTVRQLPRPVSDTPREKGFERPRSTAAVGRGEGPFAAWLPVLHTTRGRRHYTALFSNTALAHRLARTDDWVVIYWDNGRGERQGTVVTADRGPLKGRRIVRGREAESEHAPVANVAVSSSASARGTRPA